MSLTLKSNCRISVKSVEIGVFSEDEILNSWAKQVSKDLTESIVASFPSTLSDVERRDWEGLSASMRTQPICPPDIAIESLRGIQEEFFARDLANSPFRFSMLSPELVPRNSVPLNFPELTVSLEQYLPDSLSVGLRELVNLCTIKRSFIPSGSDPIPIGMIFATRPLSLANCPWSTMHRFLPSQAIILGRLFWRFVVLGPRV